MKIKLMILPSREFRNIRLLSIPEDMEEHEAFRNATGLIAAYQEQGSGSYEELEELLEEKGFATVDYIMGPELDSLG
ncbi:MAG: hypothetical protein OEZ68_09960 [Gammaproteobacteria bacterium]|nr:hypothetical protein [Gammaproteobacteria bacterium]MDH5801113.1 hypothetical protein [Gammaproteobacteria bacterium]